MLDLYRTIENPLVRVLARMEHVGVAVDRQELRRSTPACSGEVQRLGVELQVLSGRDDLNINSTLQLREILFDPPPGAVASRR